MIAGIAKGRSAFTMVELLVVIAIIGILAALLLPVIQKIRCTAREGASRAVIHDIEIGMKTYQSDWGDFPTDDNAGGSRNLYTCLTTLQMNGPYYAFRPRNIYGGNQGILDEMGDTQGSPPNSLIRYDRARADVPDPALQNQFTFDLWSMAGCVPVTAKTGPSGAVICNWK